MSRALHSKKGTDWSFWSIFRLFVFTKAKHGFIKSYIVIRWLCAVRMATWISYANLRITSARRCRHRRRCTRERWRQEQKYNITGIACVLLSTSRRLLQSIFCATSSLAQALCFKLAFTVLRMRRAFHFGLIAGSSCCVTSHGWRHWSSRGTCQRWATRRSRACMRWGGLYCLSFGHFEFQLLSRSPTS
jgi:hypothetical protein